MIDFTEYSREELFKLCEEANAAFQKLNKDENVKRMRKKSGRVNTKSALVTFLYLLMRDVATPGQIEQILLSVSNANGREDKKSFETMQLTNGWLGKYCIDVAERLSVNKFSDNIVSKERVSKRK